MTFTTFQLFLIKIKKKIVNLKINQIYVENKMFKRNNKISDI